MKTTKAIILITIAFIVANLLSCTFTRNVDGSVSGSVDATTAASIAAKIITEK